MRKLKIITSILLTAALLAGCGSKDNKQTPANSNNTTTKTTSEAGKVDTSDNKQGGYEKSDLLPLHFDDRLMDFSIDVPGGQSYISSGGQIVSGKDFYVSIDQYYDDFAKSYGYKLEQMKSPKDIFPAMQKSFFDITDAELISNPVHKLTLGEVSKSEDKKINGYNMCRFEGYLNAPSDKVKDNKCQFVGYSTFYKEKPVYFVVVDKSKDQSKKDYIGKVADAMAKTLRERKK